MATTIGSLTVDLLLKSAQFNSEIAKSSKAVATHAAAMKRSLNSIEGSLGAVTRAAKAYLGIFTISKVVTFGRSALQNAANLKEQAQALNLGTEQLQNYQYAAEQVGASSEDITSLFAKMTKAVGDAKLGTGALFELLKTGNPTLLAQIQNTKDSAAAFDLLINSIKNGADEFTKASLSSAAFGKGFKEVLKLATDDFQGAIDKAKQFNLAIGDDAAGKVDKLFDSLNTLSRAATAAFVTGFVKEFGGDVLDTADNVQKVKDLFTEIGDKSAKAVRLVADIVQTLGDNLGTVKLALEGLIALKVASYFYGLAGAIKAAVHETHELILAQHEFETTTAIGRAALVVTAIIEDLTSKTHDLAEDQRVLNEENDKQIPGWRALAEAMGLIPPAATAASDGVKSTTDNFGLMPGVLQNATLSLQGFDEELKQVVSDFQNLPTPESVKELFSMGLNGANLAPKVTVSPKVNTKSSDKAKDSVETQADAIDKLNKAVGLSLDPLAEFAKKQEAIHAAQAKGLDVTNAQISAYASMGSAVTDLAGTAVTAFGQMFKDNKAFAVASAVINTAGAIMKTLEQFGATPWGLAAAAVAAATGAAQIATIISAQPGTSKKPSAKAGGGGAAATTGAQKNGESFSRSPRQAVTINLMGQGGFTRDQVRQLADELNGLVADGATIRTA